MTPENATPMIDLATFIFIFLVVVSGALSHWAKKKAFKEVRGSLVDYLFYSNRGRTGATFIALFSSAFAVAQTTASAVVDPAWLWECIVNTGGVPTVSFVALVATWQSGWQMNSMINKGQE